MPKKNPNLKNSKPKISFVLTEEQMYSSDADAFILPTRRKTDEFGYNVSCKIGIKSTDKKVFLFDGVCAIKGTKDVAKFIQTICNDSRQEIYAAEIDSPFRILLIDAKFYSLIRHIVGIENGRRILEALGDMALKAGRKEWPEFSTDPVRTLAMLRSSEAFFAYRRGERMLKGLEGDSDDSQRQFRVQLKGNGPKYNFDFKFEEANILRGRISVLIGKNGCGKTSSLAKISKALIDTQSRVATIPDRPDVNQVVVFIHTSSVREFMPSSKMGAARAMVFTFNPGTPRKANSESMSVLLVDVARGHDNKGSLLNHFSQILKEEFPELKMFVPMAIENTGRFRPEVEYIPFEDWMSGNEQQILENAGRTDTWSSLKFQDNEGNDRKLSLGQNSFLRFVLTVLSNAGPASVLIIDEPENFLHPNLISRFMRTLNRILEGTRSIAIIATHSPFVVREVQSAHVHVMSIEDGCCIIKKPLTQTLGASISTISNEVFGDDLPNHLYEELLDRARTTSQTFDEALELYASELSVRALMTLRMKMER
ncbi:ATP-binding cassette domain-containing protein [Pseudomonas caspiana]|nr:ATP-binding protein [Pseudomonas caspiana]TPG90325.1 ATP-binding cassette domain-containing protein [Pseudomonas caspiana]